MLHVGDTYVTINLTTYNGTKMKPLSRYSKQMFISQHVTQNVETL